MAAQRSKFHIAMYPWLAMGHFTPYLHLANELAQRGYKISFLLPNKPLIQLQHMNLHPHLITFYPITVPHVDGLPPGTESASDIHVSKDNLLITALDLTRPQVETYLHSLKPDFVFFDFAYWVPELASGIGFKTVNYRVVSAALFKLYFGSPATSEQPPMRPYEVDDGQSILKRISGSGISFRDRDLTALQNSDANAIRTCKELEGPMCDHVASQMNKSLLLKGPVLPSPNGTQLEARWGEWLSQFSLGSVVFCALGSQWILNKALFQELMLGLESTGLPFLAALKPPVGAATVEEALPKGFEERVKGRGVVYGGWVQQPLILDHPSVGCFVSHCGLGSLWESLVSDSQIVLLPHMMDHIMNTKLLANEHKVAVEVERDDDGGFTKESLCKAIKSVMGEDSEVGHLIKNNHSKLKKTLLAAGFMSGYIDRFVEDLHKL